MSDIILPDYFDDPSELGGQIRRQVNSALTVIAQKLFDFDSIPNDEYKVYGGGYQRRLFEATVPPEQRLIDPVEPFNSDHSLNILNWKKACAALLQTAKIKDDPTLMMVLSATRFMGVYYQSEYVRWRACNVRDTQPATEAFGHIQKTNIAYDGKGIAGSIYWQGYEEDTGFTQIGSSDFSGEKVEITFYLPRLPDIPYPRSMRVSACIRIENF